MTLTDDMIRELCSITTRDQAGRHFTEAYDHWRELEDAGLIEVQRPVHGPTGLSYDQQYYTVEVTPEGMSVVEAYPELHPD